MEELHEIHEEIQDTSSFADGAPQEMEVPGTTNEVLRKTFTFIISYLVYLVVMGAVLDLWGRLKGSTRQLIAESVSTYLVGRDSVPEDKKEGDEDEVFIDTDVTPATHHDTEADVEPDTIYTDILTADMLPDLEAETSVMKVDIEEGKWPNIRAEAYMQAAMVEEEVLVPLADEHIMAEEQPVTPTEPCIPSYPEETILADKNEGESAGREPHREESEEGDKEPVIQAAIQSEVQSSRQADAKVDIQIDIRIGTQRDIQADIQTNIETETQTDDISVPQTDDKITVETGMDAESNAEDSGHESGSNDDGEVRDFDDFSVYGIAESFVQDTINKAVEQCQQMEQQILA